MISWITPVLAGIVSVVMSSAGVDFYSWQFWAVIICISIQPIILGILYERN